MGNGTRTVSHDSRALIAWPLILSGLLHVAVFKFSGDRPTQPTVSDTFQVVRWAPVRVSRRSGKTELFETERGGGEPSHSSGAQSQSEVALSSILNWGNSAPVYPEAAEQKGWQGTVRLHLRLDDRGGVSTVALVSSSGFSLLDRAAIAAARNWRVPETFLRQTHVAAFEVPVVFELEAIRAQ